MTSPAPLKPRTWWISHGAIAAAILVVLARYSLQGWNDLPPPGGWIYIDFRKFAVVTAALLATLYVAISTVIAARTKTRTWQWMIFVQVSALLLAVVAWWLFSATGLSDKLTRMVPNPPGWQGPP